MWKKPLERLDISPEVKGPAELLRVSSEVRVSVRSLPRHYSKQWTGLPRPQGLLALAEAQTRR